MPPDHRRTSVNDQTGDELTFGIEEEFFVVDRDGRLAQADDVVDRAA